MSTVTGPENIAIVEEAVYQVAYKWFHLGLALGLPYHALKSIPIDFLGSERCCIEMLRTWLDRWSMDGFSPTWLSLVLALDSPLVSGQECVEEILFYYQYGKTPSDSVYDSLEVLTNFQAEKERRQAMRKRRVH